MTGRDTCRMANDWVRDGAGRVCAISGGGEVCPRAPTARVYTHGDCAYSARALGELRGAGVSVSVVECPAELALGSARARAWLHAQLPPDVARVHATFPAVFLSYSPSEPLRFIGGADATSALLRGRK